MGGVNSCRCSKEKEKNELDLVKEQTGHINASSHISKDKKENFVKNSNFKNERLISAGEENNFINEDNNFEKPSSKKYIIESVNQNNRITPMNNSPAITNIHHAKQTSEDLNLEVFDDPALSYEEIQLISNGVNRGSNKKFQNFGTGLTSSSKAPLEIINELNVDISNCSHEGGKSAQKEKNKELIQNSPNLVSSIEFINQNGNGSEYSKTNKSPLLEIKKTEDNKIISKKNNKNLKIWQNITSIIPESRLLNCSEDDVLFQSDLKKLVNNEITAHSSQMYSTRYCLITKSEFKYYKSKEQFLTLQKPLYAVPLFLILEASLIKSKPQSKKFDHLYIKIDNTNKHLDNHSSRLETKSFKHPDHNESLSKAHRITLIERDSKNLNSSIRKGRNMNESIVANSENFILLTSDKEDLINKWAVIINYFLAR